MHAMQALTKMWLVLLAVNILEHLQAFLVLCNSNTPEVLSMATQLRQEQVGLSAPPSTHQQIHRSPAQPHADV